MSPVYFRRLGDCVGNSLKNCIFDGPAYLTSRSEENSVIRFFGRRRTPLNNSALGGSNFAPVDFDGVRFLDSTTSPSEDSGSTDRDVEMLFC